MITGLYPPIPTPFVDGEFSRDRFAGNLDRWNEMPLDGYVVLGSNGEAPLLDDDERTAVVRQARDRIGSDRKMIVGAGAESTRATTRVIGEAFDLGADAVLVGVPTYYRPAMTLATLRDHFLRVADASPGPILLYNVPVFTALPVEPALFTELIGHDRICGIKDSSGDIETTTAYLDAARMVEDASVLIGSARILARGLFLGATGGVLAVSCVAAGITREITEYVAAGRNEDALELNEKLDPLTAAVTTRYGIGGLKAALDLIHLYGGEPRSPLKPAAVAARSEIAGLMKGLGLLT